MPSPKSGLLAVALTIWALSPATLPAATAAETEQGAAHGNEGRLLSGVRQLTFEGKRAGEGYFSADGRKMVFQSEREPGNPFYQIYLMDLETGDTSRVSPGIGQTTCAWIHPSGEKVLFASTHEDPRAAERVHGSVTSRTWSAATFVRSWVAPLGQWITISRAAVSSPRPKWTRRSDELL